MEGAPSAAAGPVGRHAGAGTDWKMDTEILTARVRRACSPGSRWKARRSGRTMILGMAIYGRDVTHWAVLFGRSTSCAISILPFLAEVHGAKVEAKAAEKADEKPKQNDQKSDLQSWSIAVDRRRISSPSMFIPEENYIKTGSTIITPLVIMRRRPIITTRQRNTTRPRSTKKKRTTPTSLMVMVSMPLVIETEAAKQHAEECGSKLTPSAQAGQKKECSTTHFKTTRIGASLPNGLAPFFWRLRSPISEIDLFRFDRDLPKVSRRATDLTLSPCNSGL